ncbi:VWA domain-containing protein [bacterium]|nr:VWA domain-containing protein [bacterium]
MTSMRVAQLGELQGRWVLNEEQKNFGCLRSQRGALPLNELGLRAVVRGLDYSLRLTQVFVNVHSDSIEAVYTFPLPGRAAVSAFRMVCGDRLVEGRLRERAQARAEYRQAVQSGQQAAIVEEERPEIFTLTLGNLPAGASVRVELELDGPLQCIDNHALLRFPLVVAPRYIPGQPLSGKDVGAGVHHDTDRTPDASRISPPTLLPGYPNPVLLSIEVELDSPLADWRNLRASIPLELEQNRLQYSPAMGAINQDFVLALPFPTHEWTTSLQVQDDTFCLTVVPPGQAAEPTEPKQVVILLDRSSSMAGWAMAAARRVVARLIHSLNQDDSFAILAFDDRVELVQPGADCKASPGWFGLNRPAGSLAPALEERVNVVLHALEAIQARGGTEMKSALEIGLRHLGQAGHIVLITDGQVGNEAEIHQLCANRARNAKISCIGISEAVNGDFLQRLSESTGGLCQLVNNDTQLDESMTAICRRIGNPVLRDLQLTGAPLSELVYQHRDLYPGVVTRIYGRICGQPRTLHLSARRADGSSYTQELPVSPCQGTIKKLWARERVLQLEHAFMIGAGDHSEVLKFSLKHGVLSRFTAFLAVDSQSQVPVQRQTLVQPVELPISQQAQGAPSERVTGMIRVDLLPTERRQLPFNPIQLLLWLLGLLLFLLGLMKLAGLLFGK